MSSRLEPMCTTLMIDYRSDVWAACKCVGALLRCVLIRTGTRTGPATAALTAGAMKPLSGRAAAAAAAQLLWAWRARRTRPTRGSASNYEGLDGAVRQSRRGHSFRTSPGRARGAPHPRQLRHPGGTDTARTTPSFGGFSTC